MACVDISPPSMNKLTISDRSNEAMQRIGKFADLLDFTVINLQEAGMSAEREYCSLYIKLLKKRSENLITNHQRWLFENGRDDVVEALCEWVCDEAEFEMVTSETAQGLFNSFPQSVKNYNRNCNQKQQQSVTTHFD